MNPDRVRWTDSRLDDRFKQIDDDLAELRSVPKNLAEQAEQMRQLRKDMDDCGASVKQHRADFATYIAEQHKTREADRQAQSEIREDDRRQRTATTRWIITFILSSTAIVITAMGILLSHFS